MKNLGKAIRRALAFLFQVRPSQNIYPNIVVLGTSELLKGRTALITGGSSGIGLAIAKAFIASGATVVITGRNPLSIKEACDAISSSAPEENRIFGITMDVSKIDELESKFAQATNLLDGKPIDILVNNAGILNGAASSGEDVAFDEVLATNLKGAFFLTKIASRHMKSKMIQGNVLFLASSSSLRPAVSAYTLSKWGIRGLVVGAAKALVRHGIVVNGIAPGPTSTPMLSKNSKEGIQNSSSPIGRYVMPEEIANMAVFLTSDAGRTIIGDIIYMTGGSGITTFDDVEYEFS